MSDSEIMEFARAGFARMDERLDAFTDALVDLNLRLTALELGVSMLQRAFIGLRDRAASAEARLDRIDERLCRIERRLGLEPPL